MCGWYPEEIKESKMYKIYTQPSCGYCYMAKELLTKELLINKKIAGRLWNHMCLWKHNWLQENGDNSIS